MTTEAQEQVRQGLVASAKSTLADIEDMMRAQASVTGEKAAELREKIATALRKAKDNLADSQAVVMDRAKEAAQATDDYVHDHPWQAVGVAAGLGFVLGLLLSRR
jgi:ElaB/YqjD/DUF883 family membrane-anchored ribosome-binding protein